jgi:hypothetical protein
MAGVLCLVAYQKENVEANTLKNIRHSHRLSLQVPQINAPAGAQDRNKKSKRCFCTKYKKLFYFGQESEISDTLFFCYSQLFLLFFSNMSPALYTGLTERTIGVFNNSF